jgi:hypothetical protein
MSDPIEVNLTVVIALTARLENQIERIITVLTTAQTKWENEHYCADDSTD